MRVLYQVTFALACEEKTILVVSSSASLAQAQVREEFPGCDILSIYPCRAMR